MSQPKRIVYRGVPMIEGWPEKITSAQLIQAYTLKGREVLRIRYGDEHDDWGANEHPCHDCRVFKGEFHVLGCDGEECPVCGAQLRHHKLAGRLPAFPAEPLWLVHTLC